MNYGALFVFLLGTALLIWHRDFLTKVMKIDYHNKPEYKTGVIGVAIVALIGGGLLFLDSIL